ncbi:DUF7693 family protein [Methylobacterium hispanicum]|nr:hypothetical protein [Methylobacterium hispanicum]
MRAATAAALLRLHRGLDAEWRRRRISDEAYRFGTRRARDLYQAARSPVRDDDALLTEIGQIMPALLALPRPPSPELPPLPAGQVAVGEVVALLRRILAGSAEPAMVAPPLAWKQLYHSVGELRADGWLLRLFVRDGGLSYCQGVVAPDGRRAEHEEMDGREGEPVGLLEDDEQERLCALVDRLDADPDATREALRGARADTPLEREMLRARLSAWLALMGASAEGGRCRPEEQLERLRTGDARRLGAVDLEFLWEVEEILARTPPAKP